MGKTFVALTTAHCGPTDNDRCHARFAILEMVGPNAALPPSRQEKRVYGALAARRAVPRSAPAGRFYYQSHDITETVANQTAVSLECGYYHNTARVL